MLKKIKKCFCDSKSFKKRFIYKKKPRLETDFEISSKKYFREYFECQQCGHFYSYHKINLTSLYKKKYSQKTYSDISNIDKVFKKIISLPLKKSDNKNRVKRITNTINVKKNSKLLDFGSGLGVFPYEIKKKINNVFAIETDKLLIKNLLNKKIKFVGTNLSYMKKKYIKFFDIICFNKVLEHVQNPISFLKKSKKYLKKDGIIYIELPDTMAKTIGKFREEFFIEHHHVFSKTSFSHFVKKSGFRIINSKSIIEKSGKFTIYGFVKSI